MLGALISILSLDMTRKLVAAGVVATSLTVIDATNTTPIVVTTDAPHRIVPGRPVHAVVSDVAGNDDANGVWVLTYASSTTLTLSTFTMQGIYSPSAGSGAYTSGGTINVAFPDGSILLGRRNVAMQTAVATPRIVFVPQGSPAWGLDPYGGAMPPTARTQALLTAEQKSILSQRQLATEAVTFEVHVSGCAPVASPDFGDFDATQAVYHELFETMFRLITPSRAMVLGGHWVSQDASMQTFDTRGQKWVGIVQIQVPVVARALEFVPVDTIGTLTVNFTTGSSSDATIVTIP